MTKQLQLRKLLEGFNDSGGNLLNKRFLEYIKWILESG